MSDVFWIRLNGVVPVGPDAAQLAIKIRLPLQIELGRTAPGSPERRIVLASLESGAGSFAEATFSAVNAGFRLRTDTAARRRGASTFRLRPGKRYSLSATRSLRGHLAQAFLWQAKSVTARMHLERRRC